MAGKRKAKQLAVPDIAEDAAERKRVLNVLAQRRYRQRRKDRLHALESQLKSPQHTASTCGSSSSSPVSVDVLDNVDRSLNGQEDTMTNVRVVRDPNEEFVLPQITSDPFLQLFSTPQSEIDLSIPTTDDLFWSLATFPDESTQSAQADTMEGANTPSSKIITSANRLDICTALQTSESSSFSFPDDKTLEVPSLTLLNAATKVAYRLNLAHLIWDLTATSPFYRPPSSSRDSSLSTSTPSTTSLSESDCLETNPLPPHLLPTQTQRLIPHHPLLDLLPWPSTRDKFI